MSEELLTKEDLAILEKEIADTKSKIKSSLSDKEREAIEATIRKDLEEKLRKELEEKKKKLEEEAKEAIKKADQESQLAKIKELEDKYNALLESSKQSQGTASGSPFDEPQRDINDATEEELLRIDQASMKVFFQERQGLNFR